MHASRVPLVVEVAQSSLVFDRRTKGSLYARGGVVHRIPARDVSGTYGWRYQAVERLAPPATVTLLALPTVRIGAGDLLP